MSTLAGVGYEVDKIGMLRRNPQQSFATAADDDRGTGLLDRFRPQDGVLQMIELALEGGLLVGPQRFDAGERFVQHPQPLRDRRKRDSGHLEFGFRPSST